MKKFIAAILAIIYLVVSSGVAINIHYCMGKLASVDLMHSSDKCSKCGMKNGTKSGCCKDEFKIVKLSDSHKLISNDINIFTPVAVVDNSKSIFDAVIFSSKLTPNYNSNSPPQSSALSFNILYSVFRI